MGMKQQILWTKYLIPWLALGLITSYLFYLSRNYTWVVVILGVASIEFGMRRYFERRTPKDKFHILQPWRIPDPATRRDLLGRAGFDALLYLPLYIALAVFLAVVAELSAVLIGVTAMGVLVVIFVKRYWRMRRQYETALNRGQEKGHGGQLSYVGPSDLNRNERWTIGVATAGLIAAWFLIPLLLVLWISRG